MLAPREEFQKAGFGNGSNVHMLVQYENLPLCFCFFKYSSFFFFSSSFPNSYTWPILSGFSASPVICRSCSQLRVFTLCSLAFLSYQFCFPAFFLYFLQSHIFTEACVSQRIEGSGMHYLTTCRPSPLALTFFVIYFT